MSSSSTFHVAIIGGGLCGLCLAIALRNRSIPYTIYEARASFTEIGAGINLGPNTLKAFELIDKDLGEAVRKLCTRNPPGREDVWMQIRLGAATDHFMDAELVTELMAPPIGNSTARRNDILALLAERAGRECAAFNKKLATLEQCSSHVTLKFADGTEDIASVVIGCDGIHSVVRRLQVGADNPSASPQFSECGVYRAVLPREKLEQAVGPEIARTSNVFAGPGGYLIMYPVEGEQSVNVGFWPWRRGPWTEHEWVLPSQKDAMEKTFASWGETAHKIMALIDDPPFFATHHHSIQPDSFHQGRVCFIGDAAHSMPPHQGAGAGQAMEDAYVLAEVLGHIQMEDPIERQVEAAFHGYEAVRKPRAQRVLTTSVEAMGFWSDLYRKDLQKEDVQDFVQKANERFQWIWYDDIARQAERACEAMQEYLSRADTHSPRVNEKL
ncbi:MAG: hypothetical protein M1821_002461 [Bathelium mastoideum]|nr:MAG: hypothetical protein M1821_002461 [Bathelium mastoideum]